MKVILISGKAQNGKDTSAGLLAKELVCRGHRSMIVHFADLLKYICKQYFNWDGKKDNKGRFLLQYIGTDVIRKSNPDFFVNHISVLLPYLFRVCLVDHIIIPDCRFPNEIDVLKQAGFEVIHIRVVRPNFNTSLTDEQQQHPSETALDDVQPDYTIINDGTPEELAGKLSDIADQLQGIYRFTMDDICCTVS